VSERHAAPDVDTAARVAAGGSWSCTPDGATAHVTVQGVDTDPDAAPTEHWDGSAIDGRVLSAGAVTVFIPDSAIGKGGLATVAVSPVDGSVNGASRQDPVTTSSVGTGGAALVIYHWTDQPAAVGAPLTWHYAVTNTGTASFSSVNVTDSAGPNMTATRTDPLAPGATWSFTLDGTQTTATVNSIVNATGLRSDGAPASATHEAVSAVPLKPQIDVISTDTTTTVADTTTTYTGTTTTIDPPSRNVVAAVGEKTEIHIYVNGTEYDSAPGPLAVAGAPNLIEYEIKNISAATISNVVVDDSSITNDATILDCGFDATTKNKITSIEAGSSELCQRTVQPVAGNATFTVAVTVGAAADASKAVGYQAKTGSLDLELSVNGNDADTPPGPNVAPNSILTFSYSLHNTGQVDLSNITILHANDDEGVYDDIACAAVGDDTDGDNTVDILRAGQSVICTFTPRAVSGAFATEATATGTAVNADDEDLTNADGPIEVSDTDKLNYVGTGTVGGSTTGGTTGTPTVTQAPVVASGGDIGNGGANTTAVAITAAAVFITGFGLWTVTRRRPALVD
jgi:hypothetical protein